MTIRILKKEEWRAEPKSKGAGSYLIDLRKCKTNGEVIFALGQVIRSDESAPIYEDSVLSGLEDVMFDFFSELWDKKKYITIIGLEKVSKIDSLFAHKLVVAFHHAFLASLETKYRLKKDPNISDEMNKTMIDLVWN